MISTVINDRVTVVRYINQSLIAWGEWNRPNRGHEIEEEELEGEEIPPARARRLRRRANERARRARERMEREYRENQRRINEELERIANDHNY